MYQVRPWLAIGKYAETTQGPYLYRSAIRAMLQLAAPVPQPDIESLYIAVEDGVALPPDKLRQGVAFIRAQKAAERAVLVACGAGISRSVTFGLAALKEEEGLTLLDAYRAIHAVHPDALPHKALWDSLCQYYSENSDYFALLDVFMDKS